jgi:hypothetical protein
MACLQVTSGERSEFLILGQPLFDVAVAEKLAEKGQLVLSGSAHRLLFVEGGDKCPQVLRTSPFVNTLAAHSFVKLNNSDCFLVSSDLPIYQKISNLHIGNFPSNPVHLHSISIDSVPNKDPFSPNNIVQTLSSIVSTKKPECDTDTISGFSVDISY